MIDSQMVSRMPTFVDAIRRPVELAKDALAGAATATFFGAWFLDLLHGIEIDVGSGLTIVLLILRIRAHLRLTNVPSDPPK